MWGPWKREEEGPPYGPARNDSGKLCSFSHVALTVVDFCTDSGWAFGRASPDGTALISEIAAQSGRPSPPFFGQNCLRVPQFRSQVSTSRRITSKRRVRRRGEKFSTFHLL